MTIINVVRVFPLCVRNVQWFVVCPARFASVIGYIYK